MNHQAYQPRLPYLAALLLTFGLSSGARAATVSPQDRPVLQVSPDAIYLEKTNETTLTRSVNVHAPGGPSAAVNFTVSTSTASGGNWLSATPKSGGTPADVTITATPGSLAAGSYTGTVTVTPSTQGASPINVSVVLRVLSTGGSASGGLVVRPSSLNFSMSAGGSNPDSKTLDISLPNATPATAWTVVTSGGSWLSAKPTSGAGSGTVTVATNGAGLAAGTYNGTVTVTSGTTNIAVPVTLAVQSPSTSSNTQIVINPQAFNFIVPPNAAAPSSKIMRVKVTPATAAWTAKATSTGNWLAISPASGTGAGNITLTVNTAGLSTGMYEGSVAVTANGRTESARVYLRFVGSSNSQGGNGGNSSNGSAVRIDPQVVNFTAPVGGTVTPTSVPVQLTSSTTGLSFTAQGSTTSGGNWLSVTPASGTIPSALAISANASNLTAGTYSGLVTVKITGTVTETRTIVVTLKVGTTSATSQRLALSTGSVVFQVVQGAADPSPASVNLTAQGATTIPFAATASTTNGGSWLTVQPTTGIAPAAITVAATNVKTLTPGVYRGKVDFQSTGIVSATPATLNVILVVRSAASQNDAASPILAFFLEPSTGFHSDGRYATAVRVLLVHQNGSPVTGAEVELHSSGVENEVELDEVGNGIYAGTFQPLRSGAVSLSITVETDRGPEVTISVGGDVDSGDDRIPVAFPGGVVNSANFAPAPSPIAAGAILSLFGANLADNTFASSGFPLSRELGGLTILVGGIPAPIISIQPSTDFDQVNFQAPVELGDSSFVDVVVIRNGVASSPIGLTIASAVPAIYTREATGKGVVAALHADYSVITSANPAKPGETIMLYATGLGRVQGSHVSGEASGAQRVNATVQVTVDGAPAETIYAGTAPGFAGLYQVNVTIPKTAAKGTLAVVLTVNGISSGEGVTIPVN